MLGMETSRRVWSGNPTSTDSSAPVVPFPHLCSPASTTLWQQQRTARDGARLLPRRSPCLPIRRSLSGQGISRMISSTMKRRLCCLKRSRGQWSPWGIMSTPMARLRSSLTIMTPPGAVIRPEPAPQPAITIITSQVPQRITTTLARRPVTRLKAITALTLALGTSSSSTRNVQRSAAVAAMTLKDSGFKPIWPRIRVHAPWLSCTNHCSAQTLLVQPGRISGGSSTRLGQMSF